MAKKKGTIEGTVDALLAAVSFRTSEAAHLSRFDSATVKYRKPENIDGVIVELATAATDAVTIPHHLGRVPGLVILGCPTASVNYIQSTVADATNIYLTPSAATACTVKILVL